MKRKPSLLSGLGEKLKNSKILENNLIKIGRKILLDRKRRKGSPSGGTAYAKALGYMAFQGLLEERQGVKIVSHIYLVSALYQAVYQHRY